MQNIVIDKKGCKLSTNRKLLVLHHASLNKDLQIPLAQIQSLTITAQTDLSSTLLTRLSEHSISVCVLPSSRTGAACFLLGHWHAATRRREIQYAIASQEAATSYWAATLIRLKIYQQTQTLRTIQQRLFSQDELGNIQSLCHQDVLTVTQKLHRLRDKLCQYRTQQQSPTRDKHDKTAIVAFNYERYLPQHSTASLLGIEGAASALYFQCYQHFFADHWQFDRRNKRPPKDPVNVVLSLSYTLLQHIYQQALYSAGFDPYRGVLHRPSYGRESLACDFVELQRGTIDLWVWQLFYEQILDADDFDHTNSERYPCELLKSGRAKYYQAFAAIRHELSKSALRHVWIWQRRLKHYHPSDHYKSDKSDLSFASQYIE